MLTFNQKEIDTATEVAQEYGYSFDDIKETLSNRILNRLGTDIYLNAHDICAQMAIKRAKESRL